MHQVLGLISAPHKLDVAMDTCNSSTKEVEAGEVGVQGHLQLQINFEGQPGPQETLPKTTSVTIKQSKTNQKCDYLENFKCCVKTTYFFGIVQS